MAQIAKRLTFDDTGGLSAGRGNINALQDLRKAHEDVTAAIKQRSTQLMDMAKQAADGGSENDLKRLQRQFQTLKATFVNCDIKERFMHGLNQDQLDAKQQEQLNKEREQQLESAADALRQLKDQNVEARNGILAKIEQISGLYARMDAAIAVTEGQLDGIQQSIEQHEAALPPPDSPLEQGPSEVKCQARLNHETGRAKQLETSIAATEAGNADMEASIHAQEQELQAMKAEVEHLQALDADRAKAADADASTRQAAEWCEETASIISTISGVSITGIEQDSMQLRLRFSVALTNGQPQAGDAAQRTMEHDLILSFQPGTAHLCTAKLSPSVVPLDDIVQCASEGHERLPYVVEEVHARVLSYWQRQLLIEAAAERYSLTGMGLNEPCMKATLPGGLEAEVSVPWQWPNEAADSGLQLLRVAGGAVDGAALVEAVNADVALRGRDLLGFLDGVAAAAAVQQLK